MAKKQTYRVKAEVITYCYIDVEASSEEEANEKAAKIDGGDFITIENEGDFRILEGLTGSIVL